MKEALENIKKSLYSAHANGMNPNTYLNNAGVHKFSENKGATSKF
jgi:hypothetical protein